MSEASVVGLPQVDSSLKLTEFVQIAFRGNAMQQLGFVYWSFIPFECIIKSPWVDHPW